MEVVRTEVGRLLETKPMAGKQEGMERKNSS